MSIFSIFDELILPRDHRQMKFVIQMIAFEWISHDAMILD